MNDYKKILVGCVAVLAIAVTGALIEKCMDNDKYMTCIEKYSPKECK